jgi:hypothetical protein
MAVELCKVALWIEAIDPGKPLSFLDAHIQCGDSLVGVFDPKVLEEGIPDEAYKPLTGDDKTVCTSLKKENASFLKAGQKGTLQGTLNLQSTPPIGRSQQRLQEIEAMPETTLAEGSAKQAAYEAWEQERSSDPQTLAADLYTAAFFLPKTQASRSEVPTTQHLLLLQSGQEIPGDLELAVQQAARDFRFFHWHLRFGEVIDRGGFDCLLSNPPWEKINFKDEEFFGARIAAVANAPTKSARKAFITTLGESHPEVYREYGLLKRYHDSLSLFLRHGRGFPFTGKSRINLYSVFAERMSTLRGSEGRFGAVIASGIITDDNNGDLFWNWVANNQVVSVIDFENRDAIFQDVHRSYKFCLLVIGDPSFNERQGFAFYVQTAASAKDQELLKISSDDIALMNPQTRTCPIFRSAEEAIFSMCIYQNLAPHFRAPNGESRWWGTPVTAFNMANDSALFIESRSIIDESILKDSCLALDAIDATHCRLYEAKYLWQYDHRWSTYDRSMNNVLISDRIKADPNLGVNSRFWMSRSTFEGRSKNGSPWRVGYRRVSSATNQRTAAAAIFPDTPAGHTITLVEGMSAENACIFLALFNSFVFDYFVRQKVSGADLTISVFEQLPFPPLKLLSSYKDIIINNTLKLVYTSHDVAGFAADLGYSGEPILWDSETRSILKAEIDACIAHLYFSLSKPSLPQGEPFDEAKFASRMWDSFSALQTSELHAFGEFRSKRLMLEAWDRLFGVG